MGLVRCSVGTPLEYLRVPNEGLVDPEVSMGRGCGEAWMRRARRGEAPAVLPLPEPQQRHVWPAAAQLDHILGGCLYNFTTLRLCLLRIVTIAHRLNLRSSGIAAPLTSAFLAALGRAHAITSVRYECFQMR